MVHTDEVLQVFSACVVRGPARVHALDDGRHVAKDQSVHQRCQRHNDTHMHECTLSLNDLASHGSSLESRKLTSFQNHQHYFFTRSFKKKSILSLINSIKKYSIKLDLKETVYKDVFKKYFCYGVL